jgi:hypothetical protein
MIFPSEARRQSFLNLKEIVQTRDFREQIGFADGQIRITISDYQKFSDAPLPVVRQEQIACEAGGQAEEDAQLGRSGGRRRACRGQNCQNRAWGHDLFSRRSFSRVSAKTGSA